jgi:phosphatidylserine/phosphatidylglycerophosphate/cardiolipin synthase-like enzyme
MGDMLIRARERGVNVTVLLEGGPVGGISTEEKSILWKMSGHAITVSAMLPRKGEHAPYRYDHAKYVVIDRSAVLVTSENFKYSGFPPEGMTGNRGWGVYLENPKVARYFSDVFSTDAKSRSVVPFTGSPGNFEPEPERKYMAEFAPGRYEGATVRPVISPDTSFQITDLVNSAGQSIDIEQAYIKNETAYTLNPYLSAAVNASRRGVHVRVLLDSYYYNIEDENDNDEMAALINRIGTGENIPLEARCADLSAQTVDKIHNKGMIVDGRYTLVSSINWNYNFPNFNREAGVIIDHSGIARYFGDVFEDDWKSSITIPETKTDYVKITVIGGVIALLVLVYYYRHVR